MTVCPGLFRVLLTAATCALCPVPRALVAQQPFDRTRPPALGPAPNLTLPAMSERTLANGLRVIVVEQHEVPLVDISLVVRSGVELEPPERNGVATLMAALMSEGAGKRNAQAIAEQQAYLGIWIDARSGWDQTTVSMHAPTAVLDSALALFGDVALRPTFPADEFDKQKKQRLTQLLQTLDVAPSLADRAFAQILFGDAHPYGRPTTGVETTVNAITRDDVAAFYRNIFHPNNAFVIVVGDVRKGDIERRLNALFGAWEKGTVTQPSLRQETARAERRIYVIDKPNAEQASFRVGAIGVPRSTPDYYPLQVLNTILGGSFTSRLNMHLREEKGYTYGAFSGFSMRRDAGPFTARSEIMTNKADSALIFLMKDLDDLRKPVPPDEMEKAKRYLQLGMAGLFETSRDIANELSWYALYDLPLDEPTRAVTKIGAVTTNELQRVASRYIDPSKMAVVIAGDAKVLVPMLSRTHVGPVEMRDPYGKPLTKRIVQ